MSTSRAAFPAKPEGISNPDPGELHAEIEAQLARFRELTGRSPTHLDSHHHSHRLPAVREVLIDVARREGLPVRAADATVKTRLTAEQIATTDTFVERFFGADATVAVLEEILRSLQPGVTELMCHPAKVDDALRRESSYTEERSRELAVLTDPALLRLCAREGIQLIHFGEL